MTTITEELVRKRAEHNENKIGSLEEIALHQQDIIKIENLQFWCKDLKILFLQSNIISKLENLWKLKKLEYLNLAVNNIELVENLEGCESLQKLDLTLNFIGKLTSIGSLKNNCNLKELYLTGNPCWKFDGYREYVLAILPQLETLDGVTISPLDKIVAKQKFQDVELKILSQENLFIEKRKSQKQYAAQDVEKKNEASQQQVTNFWKKSSEYTPETRLEMAEQIRKINKENVVDLTDPKPKRNVKLFKMDGCPLNVNEAKIPFLLKDDEECKSFILTVDVYKNLDTSLLHVDVQPWFVRVLIKGKVLQIVLSEEVQPDKSKAQRATSSKKLVITLPKENEILKFRSNRIISGKYEEK